MSLPAPRYETRERPRRDRPYKDLECRTFGVWDNEAGAWVPKTFRFGLRAAWEEVSRLKNQLNKANT